MNTIQILLSMLTVGVGALMQGITGMGLNMFSAPLLIMIHPRLVPGPIMVGALLLTILMVLRDRSGIDLHGVGWMTAGMLPGTVLASLLLPVIPHKALALVLGGLVLAGVALSLSGLHFQPRRWLLILAGFVSGIGGTLASIGAPPVALVNQEMEPKRLRATLSGYFILSAIASLIGMVPAGRMGRTEVGLAWWLLPGIILGFLVSGIFLHRLSGKATRYLLLALSAISAVILIVQQLI